ncbi:HNH endonuclease signature motif containing protein [Pseudonocardia acaciae]|uniref:HNH endonuclease signature motif containing protein n=1 Tax=Pseudonocardia acaciae TaxID=551276 RepID=UPI000684F651|nr:HNH endonuclease signature motif containing protein [Pseudonocardia acaciae]
MSGSALLAAYGEAIEAMVRVRALVAVADGSELIEALKLGARLQRLARYGDICAIARLDREGEFTERGADAAPAVSDILRVPRRASARMVAVARAVFPTTLDGHPVEPKLPATATVLATGEIDAQHADVIERHLSSEAARRIDPARWAAAEVQLADWARLYRPDELDRMARELIEQLDQDGPPPGDGEDQVNVLHLSKSRNGVGGRVKGELDSVTFEMFARAIEAALKPDDQQKTLGERQADALGEICENALDEGRLPVKGGQRPHAVISIGYDTLLHDAKGATLDYGGYIGAGDLRRLLCDACVVPVVLGGNSEVLDVGRTQRTATKPQRDGLVARDRGCAYPGCDARAYRCQVHHVVHWAHRGRTAIHSMVLLCVTHHRMVHRAGWTIRMVDGFPEFIPPKWLDHTQTPRRKPRPTVLRV